MQVKPIQTQLSLHQPEEHTPFDDAPPARAQHLSATEKTKEKINNQPSHAEKEDAAAFDVHNATPAMKQYIQAKAEHPDALLFYRMGDFYEMFFDDAVVASAVLDITLTRRGKQAGEDIPMCGVPAHAYEAYAERLIQAGFRVAICEQMEDPKEAKKRGHKAIVRREVVRILTAGTLTEEHLLAASESCYVSAMATVDEGYALAWLECSTGAVHVSEVSPAALTATLARVAPKELLIAEASKEHVDTQTLIRDWQSIVLYKPDHMFSAERAKRWVLETYKLSSLSPLGELSAGEITALGAVFEYLALTQKAHMPRLDMPTRERSGDIMQLDAASMRNLELLVRQNGERKQSVLDTIDCTVTAGGGRLLAQWLSAPLTDIAQIAARQDAVEMLVNQPELRSSMRAILKTAADSERALSRLSLNRASARDVLAVMYNLQAARDMNGILEAGNKASMPALIAHYWQALRGHDAMIDSLQVAFKTDAGGLLKDGNFIREGYSAALDEFRSLSAGGKKAMMELQARYARETGISGLKIKFNHVLGYFIEITQIHQSKVLESFIHRQTMAGALRYSTVELGELAQNIATSSERALRLELEIFEKFTTEILAYQQSIIASARALAALDVVTSLAELAHTRRYVRPQVDASHHFIIEQGRHPVVEASLQRLSESFIANDCHMDDTQDLWLLTGPNMAGKSTYLRQNALIAILAHMGSFVPAAAAHIGVIDKLFSRVGAADDLARGQSTFMVEMAETAAILHQATRRSFVILDEIGRGTATYDGLSIARAVVEYLHDTLQCRTLFATHYHELTQLKQANSRLACYQMRVREWQDHIVFLHQVAVGAADRSYGIHVAKMAGLPAEVIAHAATYLHALEQTRAVPVAPADVSRPDAAPAVSQQRADFIAALNPDSLSPKQALDALYQLKALK